MILATFNYNNKEYVYSIIDNQVEYGYRNDDGSICNEITDEEKKLMNKIYMKFVISKDSKNHKKCGIVDYNNKKFQIMYDKISEIKFFYEITQDGYKIPDYDDYLYLDDKLNPEFLDNNNEKSDISESDNAKNRKDNFVRTLYIGASVFYIFSSVNYLAMSYNISNPNLESGYEIDVESDVYGDMDVTLTPDDLKETFLKNEYISAQEKNYLKDYMTIIDENVDYIDMNVCNKRLSTLKISWHAEKNSVRGRYFPDENLIVIYGCSSFKEANALVKKTLVHEFYHTLTPKFQSLGLKTYEAMNEIMALEYSGKELSYSSIIYGNGSYRIERGAVYLLIELLGPDILREYYFKNEPQILVDNLTDIIDDEDKAYELIGLIDNLHINYEEKISKCENESEKSQILSDVYLPYNNLINEYFNVKYGYDMVEDEVMQAYVYLQSGIHKPDFITELHLQARDTIEGVAGVYYDLVIPYFSKEYINKYPNGVPRQSFKIGNSDKELIYIIEEERQNVISGKKY